MATLENGNNLGITNSPGSYPVARLQKALFTPNLTHARHRAVYKPLSDLINHKKIEKVKMSISRASRTRQSANFTAIGRRRLARNSISLGNLDTIDEWPETVKVQIIDLDDHQKRPKVGLFGKFSQKIFGNRITVGKSLRKSATRMECSLNNNTKLAPLTKRLRKYLTKNHNQSIRTKKTPILAQKEIVLNGMTIWEEEMNGSVDVFSF